MISFKWNSTHMIQAQVGLIQENQRDECGKNLLCKSCEIAHQYAALKGHDNDGYHEDPKADPCSKR